MQRIEVPVLIVGAGPVGMLASILLAQQGIENRVVERREGPHRAPQAHVLNARSLEICRAAGLDVEAIRRAGPPPQDGAQVLFVTRLTGEELGRLAFGNERAGVHTSPTPMLNLPQHVFEPILLERLRKDHGRNPCYGHQWEASQQDADGVTSRICDLASGTQYELRSRSVLAADGAGSRVRRSLGIEMDGPERLQSFAMIHVEANLRALVEERPGILYWLFDPDCRGVLVAHDIDRTWVYMHPFDPARESVDDYTAPVCTELARRAIGRDDVELEVRNVSIWHMSAQVAEHYRSGRIFLVGDAAHRFPPTGGLGMNTGMQDVHNLVWKLRAVADGWAPEALLESYEVERRRVAQDNTRQSLENAVKMTEVIRAVGASEDAAASRASLEAVLADPAARQRLRDAIEDQREHFDMLALELGFAYEAGAVVPDGTPKPVGASAVSDFVPTSRPGSRLPHAWVERDGVRVSSLDLVPYDRFTLLAGPDAAAWSEAAARIGDVPLQCLAPGRDFADPERAWSAVCGIEADGALLVRPDQHVAWRAPRGVANATGELARALRSVLSTEPS